MITAYRIDGNKVFVTTVGYAGHVELSTTSSTNDKREPDKLTCTGVSAVWCPIHGDCKCPEDNRYNDLKCPLHGTASAHGEECTCTPRTVCPVHG